MAECSCTISGERTRSFSPLAVLAHIGAERDEFCAEVGEASDDHAIVSAMLGARPMARAERVAVRELVVLAQLGRALDAYLAGVVSGVELGRGLELLAAANDLFEGLGPGRVWARALLDLARHQGERWDDAARGQVVLLTRELRGVLAEQLGVGSWQCSRCAMRLISHPLAIAMSDIHELRAFDAAAAECVAGPPNYAGGGVVAWAFVRGWVILPILVAAYGDEPEHADGLRAALDVSDTLVVMARSPGSRYRVMGDRLDVVEPLRSGAYVGADHAAEVLAQPRRRSIITSTTWSFAIVEQGEHVIVAAPRDVAETLCGAAVHDVMADYRAALERQYEDEDVPSEFVRLERSVGRLLRRQRPAG